jgi:hypothetical protein
MTLLHDIDNILQILDDAANWKSEIMRQQRLIHAEVRLGSLKNWVAKLEADNETLRQKVANLEI